jgi:hypothetical protein
MNVYCFWECTTTSIVFLVDTVEVVECCPFHEGEPPEIDDDTELPYPNHFEDGHLRRVFLGKLLK